MPLDISASNSWELSARCAWIIIANRKLLEGSQNGIAAALSTRYEITNQAVWLRDGAYKAFGYTGDGELSRRITTLQADVDGLKAWLNDVREDSTHAIPAPRLTTLGWNLPRLRATDNSMGSWGYHPDGPIKFNDSFSRERPTAIREIRAIQARCIDKLEVTYATLDVGRWGDAVHNTVVEHGGNGGEWSETSLELDFGEYITSITGTTNKRGTVTVTQLEIMTSKNKKWKYPSDPWSSFEPTTQTYDQQANLLVSFAGSSGDFLNCLRGNIIRLLPADWS